MTHFSETPVDMTHLIGIPSQSTNQNKILHDKSRISNEQKPELYKDKY